MKNDQVRFKFYRLLIILILSFSLTGCGSSFSAKDLEACQSAWDSTSNALSSAPRATYSDSAPEPSFDEVMEHFQNLTSSRSNLITSASSVDSSELRLALMNFALGTGAMSIDFLNNPRAKGTSGITQFNDSFKIVLDLCESSGWER